MAPAKQVAAATKRGANARKTKAHTTKAHTTKAHTTKAPTANARTRSGEQPRNKAAAVADGTVMLAFLRGINVGGNKLVPMPELRALATALGFGEVETLIQSGNLIFTTTLTPAAAEAALEAAIAKRFGFTVDVVVRSAEQWRRTVETMPFADAAAARPHLLHLGVAKSAVRDGAVAALARYAAGGERVHAGADCLWIDYAGGAGKSKLSPAVLDRAVGSTVTARNWRTVQRLAELAAARAAGGRQP